jgi:hypothetical protein
MRISYFPDYVALAGKPLIRNFIKTINYPVIENSLDADVAVIWSVLWHGRMQSNKQVFHHYRSLNKPVVVFEIGALNRNQTWRMSINGTDVNSIYWPKELYQLNRADRILKSFKKKTKGDRILICGQNSHSHNWNKNVIMEDWICTTFNEVVKHSDRPIDIRPHPRSSLRLPDKIAQHVVNAHYTNKDDTDLLDVIDNYWAVINHNSYPGIQSRLSNINAVVNQSSLAAAVSHCAVANIEQNLDYPNQQWLDFIAHTEFYEDEIASGLCWQVIKNLLQT